MEKLDERKGIILNLAKGTNLEGLRAQVVLALDFSYSMSSLYTSGQVQELVERLLPLGLAFDDNGEVDFYLFHDGLIKLPENITRANVVGYITKKVMNKYSMGGTNYAPIINKIVEDFGGEKAEKKGIFSGLFSKKKELNETKAAPLPTYVLFITDGENGDKYDAEKAIINASKYGIFFQFVGIGSEQFNFLRKLDDLAGRVVDNANFFKVDSLSSKTDEQLYQLLLTEFPSWIPQARALKQIS